jgi:hypothetical protein
MPVKDQKRVCLFVCLFFGVGDLTQGLMHAKQTLYHSQPSGTCIFILFYFCFLCVLVFVFSMNMV